MNTGMAWRPVSNMVTPKNKVTNGVEWRHISHKVSPKGVFELFKVRKKTTNVFDVFKVSKMITKFPTSSKSAKSPLGF